MKALSGILALAIIATALAPAIAADSRTSECVTGRFHEPLCSAKRLCGTRTVVIGEREPDVIFLPHAPYVVVNWPRE